MARILILKGRFFYKESSAILRYEEDVQDSGDTVLYHFGNPYPHWEPNKKENDFLALLDLDSKPYFQRNDGQMVKLRVLTLFPWVTLVEYKKYPEH